MDFRPYGALSYCACYCVESPSLRLSFQEGLAFSQTDAHIMALLEIACFNAESALVARSAGADRIELCDNPSVGGTTPNFESLHFVRRQITTPVFIMIRPRGGSFFYTDAEFKQMKHDLLRYKPLADGFVFGILGSDQRIDTLKVAELVASARPLPCTFHRAFDETPNLKEALEDAIQCGVKAVLTSGGEANAIEGVLALQDLVIQAAGRLEIIPGGGVRYSNIMMLRQKTMASWFHSSALTTDANLASMDEIERMKSLLEI